jgi:hypothetical protein
MFPKKVISLTISAIAISFMTITTCSKQPSPETQLTAKAIQAVTKSHPKGNIMRVVKEKENGKEVFEVKIREGEKVAEITVTPDGQILEEESDETKGTERANQELIFNFDNIPVGEFPNGWSNQKTGKGGLGTWAVILDPTAPSQPNVFAQTSEEHPGYHFNVAVAEECLFSDLVIKLRFKAIDGQEDQGGGPVWRYQDADNYYICRANPLEANFRVYKVVDGNRKQLMSSNVEIRSNVWHSLEVKNIGNRIRCWFNDLLYLDVTDDTFTIGKIGLWTKADAVTWFDDVKVETEKR